MPTEAQLKAQMQAAIAAKKKKEQDTKLPDVPPASSSPSIPSTPSPDPVPSTPSDAPIDLTFYGHSIRFTTHQGQVYFAVGDLLPLSEVPDYANKFIDFKNNPKTKEKAETLIKILTFKGPNGSEKTEGATALNILAIFRELKFAAPGPLGRWLLETAEQHKKTE